MAQLKHKWLFALSWINLAVVVVILIQLAANQFTSFPSLLRALVYSLVYANLTGVLGMVVLGWFVEKLSHRFPLVATLALGIVGFTAVGSLLAQTLLMAIGFVVPRYFWREYVSTLRFAIPLATVFGLGAIVHATLRIRIQTAEEKLHRKEVAEERALKLAAETRLSSLESRIHPHFLFNTLNSISSLIAVDPARAEQIVGRLAILLRASLDSSNQPLIPLHQELGMVESYMDIERARFGDRLHGIVDIPADLRNIKVPPMSVQTLVENAVKHGITPKSSGGEVRVAACEDNGCVRIEVRDTGPGFDMTALRPSHGLHNLVERLDTLFGAQARLNICRRDGQSVVEMILPRV